MAQNQDWSTLQRNITNYAADLGLSDSDLSEMQHNIDAASSGDAGAARQSNEALAKMTERISSHPNYNEDMAYSLGLTTQSSGKSSPGGGLSGGSSRA